MHLRNVSLTFSVCLVLFVVTSWADARLIHPPLKYNSLTQFRTGAKASADNPANLAHLIAWDHVS
jgi:hypothetical protein